MSAGIRQVPWNSLGVNVGNVMTAEEAVKKGGLDWKVEKKKIYFKSESTANLVAFPSKFANVKTDTGAGLGIVGSSYNIMQNHEAFTFFDNIVAKKEAIYHMIGSLGKGQKIWLLAKLRENIVVTHDDVVEQYLLLSSSHDGINTVSVRFLPIRTVCGNTIIAKLKKFPQVVNVRHSSKMHGKIKEAQRILEISKEFYSHFKEVVNAMVNKSVTNDNIENLLSGIGYGKDKEQATRSENIRCTIKNYIEFGRGNTTNKVKGTLWAAYNGIVEYIDYGRLVKNMGDGKAENRLESVWFGSGAKLKLRAWNTAIDLLNKY